MDSEPRTRIRAISAKTLSSYGYAVCLFPEQPTREVIVEQDRATEEHIEKKVVKKVEATSKPSFELVRLHWRNRLVYLLAFVSFSLSLNNAYHFPINIYRYGETFFVPYTVATIVVGYPMHVLETSMGQYSQYGLLWVWHCAPLFFGIGLAMIVACIVMSLYHNIFAAYSLIYFARCFNKVLPWTLCNDFPSDEDNTCVPQLWYFSNNGTSSSKDYFYKVILNTDTTEPSLGSFKWWLLLSLLFSWTVVYIATFRSCRSIGKFAIIIVIFSYFAILTLLIVALQVKSSGKLVTHDRENKSIFNLQMWCSAVMQVLLELGICFGIPVVYGSYCRFRHFLLIDSLILCIINYLNSIIFFYLFFSFFNSFSCNMANFAWDIPDTTIAVIYMIYSETFSTLSGKNYWCFLFFLMLFLIVLGTQIAIAEAIMSAVYDNVRKLSHYRWFINLIICILLCSLGIIFCFANGYFIALLLYYIPTLFIIIPLSCLFVVGIVFVYGFNRYSTNMKTMRNYNFNTFFKIFLYVLVIIFILVFLITVFSINSVVLLGGIFDYESYKKNKIISWVTCIIILCPIVICAVLWIIVAHKKIFKSSNTWMRLEEDKKEGRDQFTSTYSASYSWEWNQYK